MTVCLLTIADGRDAYHNRSWRSLNAALPPVDHRVHVDDADHKLGFSGAIQEGWNRVLATTAEWVVHIELDYIFHAPVPVDAMIALMRTHPELTQVALKRQPVNPIEVAAGGIMEQDPAAFEQRRAAGQPYVVHRKWWTTNPCVYPRWIMERGWPPCAESEGHFALELFNSHHALLAGYWGALTDPPMVGHIGVVRAGAGY